MNEDFAKEYTEEDIKNRIAPLSANAFVKFFQKLAREIKGRWYLFADKKPRLSAMLYRIGFFLVFSIGVTLWQYVVMTFLPYAFKSLNNGAAGWPAVEVGSTGQKYVIFGDGQGWGYFIAFEIAVFTAQCINFPLQRNVTYRSHGNVWLQAMWYFVGWVLVSLFTNALWGIINVYLLFWGCPDAVSGIVKTLITGVISLVIFYFIFLIIFPDNAAMAKRASKRAQKLYARGAKSEKSAEAEKRAQDFEERARLSAAERELAKQKSLASSCALKYFAYAKKEAAAKDGEKKAELSAKKQAAFYGAVEAIKLKEQKQAAFEREKL